jgi:hypothetical protein
VCQTGLKSNEQHTFKKVQVVLGELFLGALLTHGASLLFSLIPVKRGIFLPIKRQQYEGLYYLYAPKNENCLNS